MKVEPFRVRSGDAEIAGVRFGQGPPLLALHPAVFSKAFFASAADEYGASFTCAAIDQRGHGETTAERVTLDDMAEDVGRVLDHLGWERATVGGTSLGAATALRFAVTRPGRVRLLVQDLPAFGPGTRRNPERAEAMAAAFGKGDFGAAADRIVEGLSPPRAGAWRDALAADWKHYDPATLGPKIAAALRAAAAWRVVERWPEDLAAIRVPTRILAIQGDPSHPYEIARAMAREVPDAKLVARVPSLSPEAIARQWVEVIRAG